MRLSDPVNRTLAKESEYCEEKVVTAKGTVSVAWKGDRTKPALLTYHDLGLNYISNFQVCNEIISLTYRVSRSDAKLLLVCCLCLNLSFLCASS